MLKPEVSLPVALSTAAIVAGVFMNAEPPVADVRTAPKGHPEIATSTKAAAWMSATIVGAVSLIAKDPTVFIIGGGMIVGMTWWYNHANEVNPEWGMAVPSGEVQEPQQFDENNMAAYENYDAAPNFF